MDNLDRLFSSLREEIDNASTIDFFFRQSNFRKQHLEPIYKKWVKDEISTLIQNAQNDLNKIIDHSINCSHEDTTFSTNKDYRQILDAAASVTAILSGLATIPMVPILATVSVGGILGWLGMTAFSWPIAIAAWIFIALSIALGGHRALKIRARATDRYMRNLESEIFKQVIGTAKIAKCICRQTQYAIESAARDILEKLET